MDIIEQNFDHFWSIYPRRPGNPRKPALEKYRALVMRHKVDPQAILDGTKAYAQSRIGEDPKYTCMAVTFLNQRRFEDYELAKVNETVLVNGFYAAADSPQMMAWDAKHRAEKGIGCPRDRKGGWLFPTEWPPDGNVVSIRRTA